MTARQLLTGATALAAGLALAACGVDTEEAGRAASVSTTPAAPGQSPQGRAPAEDAQRQTGLPRPRSGQVVVAGPPDDVLVRGVIDDFNRASSVEVRFARAQDRRAFADLCAGRVDLIETSAVPTAGIREACARNGLEVVEPLQLGSDAIVLATKNGADVGGDCVTVGQARDIFRAGSPYDSWSQLGFADLPLSTTGREPGSDAFRFFAQIVLGSTGATLGEVRSDYRAHAQEGRVRRDVTNADRVSAVARQARAHRRELLVSTRAERRRLVDAADRAADRRVLAQIRSENRRRQRQGIQVQDPRDLERRNLERITAAKAAARRQAGRRFDRVLDRRGAAFADRTLRAADRAGVLGAFRFSSYELFEEQLRPLEIDFGVPTTRSGQPVRLEDLAAADQARVRAQLARRPAPGTTTAPAEQSTLASVADLPTRTADGERIYRGPGCVFPARITITSGAYPLTRRFFLVTTAHALARREVQELLRATFDDVQRRAAELRLVPITDEQRRQAYVTFSGRPPAGQEGTAAPTTPTTTTGTTTTPGATPTTPGSGIPGVSSRTG